jgi:hypothetical protein
MTCLFLTLGFGGCEPPRLPQRKNPKKNKKASFIFIYMNTLHRHGTPFHDPLVFDPRFRAVANRQDLRKNKFSK